MELKRSFPSDFSALQQLINLAVDGVDTVIMQTGHFLLWQDDVTGEVLPCLEETMHGPHRARIRKNYGHFPLLTWSLGLELLAATPTRNKYALVIVNDWEHLSKIDQSESFFTANPRLPDSFSAELLRHDGVIKLLRPSNSLEHTGLYFSERILRHRYQKHVAELIAKGRLPPSAVVKSDEGATYCSLPDGKGSLKEAYCSGKSGDCAGEVAEMIFDATSQTGSACFINLYPLVCRKFVDHGAELAVTLFGAACPSVLNVGFPSTGVKSREDIFKGAEASLLHF
jgi:hypothetical protein